ncbi:hypothetical protein HBI56_131370 [Parastagonospora nodorum]|nr:hypothetical protein HBH56_152440 [Parastagonospora nodorum]KAH3926837.1 hypothetical protein HBH54_165240 [Parastagonospora nodorum]KAH3940423.1 hypothetical protein HBH53_218180 [Parastagonospora nodorum]KAH3970172.1 hypothetical protein HBH52_165630 [Parastagonospora nodorum]KAH3971903.1 hypothetical protein HBH51_107550 [Parastagonospora nodorum]
MSMIANSHDKRKHLPFGVGVEKTQAGGYVGWSRKLTSKKGFSGKRAVRAIDTLLVAPTSGADGTSSPNWKPLSAETSPPISLLIARAGLSGTF